MKLRAENLIKTYKGRSVVKGISVEVNQGEIVGLLGPNGAEQHRARKLERQRAARQATAHLRQV